MKEMFNRLMGITHPPIETPVRAEPAPVEAPNAVPIEKPTEEPTQPQE